MIRKVFENHDLKRMRLIFINKLLVVLLATLLLNLILHKTALPQTLSSASDFNENGNRKKLIFSVIPFKYSGISENISLIFGNRMALALKRFERFDSIAPEQTLEYLRDYRPDLLDCMDEACGKEIARILESDYYVYSELNLNLSKMFTLLTKVYKTKNGELVFRDESIFPKDDIYQNLFKVGENIHEYIPVEGLVLAGDSHRAVLKIGSEQGVKVGDKIVISRMLDFDYFIETEEKKESEDEDGGEQNTVVDVTQKKLEEDIERINATYAIAELRRVDRTISEATIILTKDKDEPALKDDIAKVYLNPILQAKYIELARQELDKFHGWDDIKKKEKIEEVVEEEPVVRPSVVPRVIVPIPLPIYEKNKWIAKVRHWEGERFFFRNMLIGSAVVGAAIGISQSGSKDNSATLLIPPIAAAGYFFYAFIMARDELDKLITEGKYKGFIDIVGDSFYTPPQFNATPQFIYSFNDQHEAPAQPVYHFPLLKLNF